mgnify:CR=1 FL=1
MNFLLNGSVICVAIFFLILIAKKIHFLGRAAGKISAPICFHKAPPIPPVGGDRKEKGKAKEKGGFDSFESGAVIVIFLIVMAGVAWLMGGVTSVKSLVLGLFLVLGVPPLMVIIPRSILNWGGVADGYSIWAGRVLGLGVLLGILGAAA